MTAIPLQKPFIPSGKVKTVLIDRYTPRDIVESLNEMEIKICFTAETNTDDSVSTHPDMQFLYLGNGKAVTWDLFYEYYVKLLKETGIEIIKAKQSFTFKYPENTALNCVICGDYLIHNHKFTDITILDECKNLTKLNVSQSYSKCSTAITGTSSIITEDSVIYETAVQNRFEACHIGRGDILLKGYDYGFIGGASGLIDKNRIAFTGNMRYHKSFETIEYFCNKQKIEMIFLSKEKPIDIGSIIPLTEEI